jgi:hypothetical protein
VFVIVIVPILVAVPLVSVLVPPAVIMFVTVGSGFRELGTPVFSLRTMGPVFFYGFMKIMVGLDRALLAIIIRAQYGTCPEHKSPGKD